MGRKRHTSPAPVPGAESLKSAASWVQPDVWKLQRDGRVVVWKTFRRSPWFLRMTLCRWMARREARNLKILQGLDWAPVFLGMPEPTTIEMTFLEAAPVPEKKFTLDSEYFDRLWKVIDEMHTRGLNHGDLRRKNLLCSTRDGSPLMVDFAQCMYCPSRKSLFFRLVQRRAYDVDRITFLKLKEWYIGTKNITAEEKAAVRNRPFHLRVGQFLKKQVYRRIKHAILRK